MVTLEGPGEIPGQPGGPTETERPKPALPGTGAEPEAPQERGSWRGREGNQ